MKYTFNWDETGDPELPRNQAENAGDSSSPCLPECPVCGASRTNLWLSLNPHGPSADREGLRGLSDSLTAPHGLSIVVRLRAADSGVYTPPALLCRTPRAWHRGQMLRGREEREGPHVIRLLFQLGIGFDETVDFVLFHLQVVQHLLVGFLERFLFFVQLRDVFFQSGHLF